MMCNLNVILMTLRSGIWSWLTTVTHRVLQKKYLQICFDVLILVSRGQYILCVNKTNKTVLIMLKVYLVHLHHDNKLNTELCIESNCQKLNSTHNGKINILRSQICLTSRYIQNYNTVQHILVSSCYFDKYKKIDTMAGQY